MRTAWQYLKYLVGTVVVGLCAAVFFGSLFTGWLTAGRVSAREFVFIMVAAFSLTFAVPYTLYQ